MRRWLEALAGTSLVVSVAQPLWAQNAAASTTPTDQLEEVVVTATKRETNLQKTPISIQVTKGEDLRKQGKQRIDEIMNGAVGVQAQSDEVGMTFFMRGIGNDRGQLGGFGSGGTQPAVAVLVDGVYQARAEAARGGTLDVAQAEVMRGPQSTNLGGSSLAGAVNLVSNKPVFDFGGSGTIGIGSYNTTNVEGVLNLPTASNQALRVAASVDKHDGYLTNGGNDDDQLLVRGKYRWQPTDKVDLVLTASHQKIGGLAVAGPQDLLTYEGYWAAVPSGGTAPAGTLTRGSPPTVYFVDNTTSYRDRSNPWDDRMPKDGFGHNPFVDTVINSWSANLDWDLGFGTLTVTPETEKAQFRSSELGTATSYGSEDRTQRTNQIDARITSPESSKLKWLAGVYYYTTDNPGVFINTVYPGTGMGGGGCAVGTATAFTNRCYTWVPTLEASQHTRSAYAQFTWPIVDALRITGGARYTGDIKHAKGVFNPAGFYAGFPGDINGPTTPYIEGPRGTGEWSAMSYRASLEYDLRPESMLYAGYSTGYQPGNLRALGPPVATWFQVTPKQTLDQITLGIKNRFFDNKLQLNAEAFHSLYHNRGLQGNVQTLANPPANCGVPAAAVNPTVIAYVSADLTCAIVSNLIVPKLTSEGLDIEVSWVPTTADKLDLSVEYLKATETTPDISTYTAAQLLSIATTQNGAVTAANPAAASAALATSLATAAGGYEGLTLQSSPKYSGNLSYQHDFRLGNGASLTPRVNMVYKSRYWTSTSGANILNPGNSYQEAYELYNAFLDWSDPSGKYTITGYVKNIQNTAVLLSYIPGATTGPNVEPASVALDAPRTYGVIANARF